MSKYSAEQVEEAIEDFGGNVSRRYSGRFMYGKECPAVEINDWTEVCEMFIDIATEDDVLARWMARTVKTDSMGRGMVVYWPSATYPDEEAAA